MTSPTATGQFHDLEALLRDMGSVVVAFSGGVDSSFLATVAHRVLGERALAVTASSPSLAPWDLEDAVNLARTVGLRHRVVETQEVELPGYRANGARRCYFCKEHLYHRFHAIAREEGLAWVIDGTNVDDLGDFRPGREAAEELSVRSPLLEVGFSKEAIRTLTQEMGLPTWDKPAQACLASRISYGVAVTVEALRQIAHAERGLRDLGFRQLRVRHDRSTARLELGPEEMERLLDPAMRQEVVRRLKGAGYLFATLDLEGYRPGSLNRVLRQVTGNPEDQRRQTP